MIRMVADRNPRWIDLFFEIIEKAYQGREFVYENETFRLDPTLVRPADFHRRTFSSSPTSYESLLKVLDPGFKSLASSEVYRVRTGWIARGLIGYNGHKIRRIAIDEDLFLIPDLSQTPSVGIDTSGLGNNETIIVVCCIPDYDGAYFFLEQHMELPKDKQKNELHWSKLNESYRKKLLENYKLTLSICCDGLLVIRTNALIDRRDKIENLFKNLVEGCLSGYEKHPTQKTLRPALKKKFFGKVNAVQTHCDSDFRPLTPNKVVRLLVQTLAKRNGGYSEKYTPLFADLRSHESRPLQITDIIAGMTKTIIDQGRLEPLQLLPFDLRKMRKYSDHPPKAYFWFP
jgi:hypothetical protein